MTSEKYRKIMWGILLSGCMLPIGNFQILPVFIGYLVIASAIKALINENGGAPYYEKEYKEAMNAMAFSVIVLVAGLVFGIIGVVGADVSLPVAIRMVMLGSHGGGVDGYPQILTQILVIAVMLQDALLCSKLASRTARVFDDFGYTESAETLRKNRMTYAKLNLGVIVLKCVQVALIALFSWASVKQAYLVIEFLTYAVLSLYLVLKIWYSMFMYKASRMEIDNLGKIAKKARK
ncbi:MAG: hypothetical protein E7269_05590 [Lachnospiraceae bacterium]|nr:hypothetical protein [Lachnospiraceae bacterium]